MISIAQFKRITLAALAVAALTMSALAQEPARKTMETDWLTIDYPEKAVPGQKFQVFVTPKAIPSGKKIGGDIHHAKPGQYLGYAAWGGNLQPAEQGKKLTFTYTMPEFKSADQGVQPIYFLTEKGWGEAELKAYGPVILPLVNAEILSTFRPETATLKKSWIVVGKPQSEDGGEPVWKEGETVVVPFEYYVDKSDDWGGTEIVLWVVGPWVDCPDGKYTNKRTHHNYHGVGASFLLSAADVSAIPSSGRWPIFECIDAVGWDASRVALENGFSRRRSASLSMERGTVYLSIGSFGNVIIFR